MARGEAKVEGAKMDACKCVRQTEIGAGWYHRTARFLVQMRRRMLHSLILENLHRPIFRITLPFGGN